MLPIRALSFLGSILIAPASAETASLPAPIAPAAMGKLQCYAPDPIRKTCNSLAGYKSGASGAIDNTAIVMVSRNPLITMETVSPVAIKAGAVCGKIRHEDIDSAKFTADGQVLGTAQAAPLRQQLTLAFKDIFGREICTTYILDGGAFIARATMDGAPMQVPDQRVIWVAPEEGYQVRP
jgi:hypothetical protein